MTKSINDPFAPQLTDGDPGMPVTDTDGCRIESRSRVDFEADSTQGDQLHQAVHGSGEGMAGGGEGMAPPVLEDGQVRSDVAALEVHAEQLLTQARDSIREHPVGAVAAGVAMGMLIARILR